MAVSYFSNDAIERFISQSHYAKCIGVQSDHQETDCLLYAIKQGNFNAWLKNTPDALIDWLRHLGFDGKIGKVIMLPAIEACAFNRPSALFIYHPETVQANFANIVEQLPIGDYRLILDEQAYDATILHDAAMGWLLQSYRFDFYKRREDDKPFSRLLLPDTPNVKSVLNQAQSVFLGRDLINLPPNALYPESLGQVVRKLATHYNATISEIIGDDLLNKNFPLIYHVGKASNFEPRLIELKWQPEKGREQKLFNLTLVGKGVTFDTGGLDIKSSNNMKLMKKDMGGAASAIAVARMVMVANLPINLRLLIPTADNAISGSAYHPSDILPSRKGTLVEINDTDAEGRLILADALSYALEAPCDLLIDFATLTGAARVALGTELPAVFCNDPDMGRQLMAIGKNCNDPCWEMPLHAPYMHHVKGKIAALNNVPSHGYGGAIHAALFLQHFTSNDQTQAGNAMDNTIETQKSSVTPWVHIDMMGWNLSKRPGHPEGGEANMARTIFNYAKQASALHIEDVLRDESI